MPASRLAWTIFGDVAEMAAGFSRAVSEDRFVLDNGGDPYWDHGSVGAMGSKWRHWPRQRFVTARIAAISITEETAGENR